MVADLGRERRTTVPEASAGFRGEGSFGGLGKGARLAQALLYWAALASSKSEEVRRKQ